MTASKRPFLALITLLTAGSTAAACDSGTGSDGADETSNEDTALEGSDTTDGSGSGENSSGVDASGTASGTDSMSGTDTGETDTSGTDTSGTDTSGTDTGVGQGACENAVTVPNASSGIVAAEGDFGPSYETVNHLGEVFNPCEVAGGRPIFLSVSTGWCGPCIDLAAHVSGVTHHDWIPAGLKPMIDSGDVLWIEYMANDASGPNEPTVDFMASWHDSYPHEKTIIAADWDHSGTYPVQLFYHLGANGFPSLSVLDADYKWAVIDAEGELVLDSLQIVHDKLAELLG